MRKEVSALFMMLFCCVAFYAQTKISGYVYDVYLEPISSITVSSNNSSTKTNSQGAFTLKVFEALPVTIQVSGAGYQAQTVEVSDLEELYIVLEKKSKLKEVVISASRIPERVLESPVTVERVGNSELLNATSPNFYDNLVNLKDVDVHTSGFNVKSINTRAFASIDNVRFVQLVDGADSANPSYNFSLGNTMGLNDLDVSSVEILPGAASALYGANAFNGILIMNSKSPFNHKGLSASLKGGITSHEISNNTPFYDLSLRFGHVFNDKTAVKVNVNYLGAQEWEANDFSNTTGLGGDIIEGTRFSNEDYDGVNVYGDEISVSITDIVRSLESEGVFPENTTALLRTFDVTRDGFNELDIINNDVKHVMLDASVYFRPFGTEDVELIYSAKYGYGDNTYRKGNTRIIQKGALNVQNKLDFKYKNYLTARIYNNKFNQGDNSHNLSLLANDLNENLLPSQNWFGIYTNTYVNTYLNGLDDDSLTSAQVHAFSREFARSTANSFVAQPGTSEFATVLNQVKENYISEGGSRLKNNSSFTHIDVNGNLSDLIDLFSLQLGGSYRRYKLDSEVELYTDINAPIFYDEFGVYAQGNVKFLKDRLSFSTSIRYDKSQNFDGNFSPRVSLTYAAGKNRNHNFRASFQTAFRNPSSEDQYSGQILAGALTAFGNIEDNYEGYTSNPYAILGGASIGIQATEVVLTGDDILNNSYTKESEEAYLRAVNNDISNNSSDSLEEAYEKHAPLLEVAKIDYLKPEQVRTLELGYRGEIDAFDRIFEVDINGYYSRFDNFITTQLVTTPYYGNVTSNSTVNSAVLALNLYDYRRHAIRVNSSEVLDFYGAGISVSTEIFTDFNLSANYMFSELKNQEELEATVKPGFNTAKHRAKVSLGNEKVFRNFGFNINARWQEGFLWQSPFLSGYVEDRTVIDAQVNLAVPTLKSNFKLGGTNITNKFYTTAPGLGSIGALYYLNWTINY